jgi:hypothetical protein
MKKGIAMSTLGYLLIAIVVLIAMILIIGNWTSEGEGFLNGLFGMVRR